MNRRYRLSSRLGTLVIWARSQAAAEASACFAHLMGEGPLFEIVTVTELPA